MKIISNLFGFFWVFMLCSKPAICQKGSIWLGGGPSLGFAISNQNFNYYYKKGIGGSLQAKFGMTKLGNITTEFSYHSFSVKNPPVDNASCLTLVKAGYQTYFKNSGFFAGADLGLSFNGDAMFSGKAYSVAGISEGIRLDFRRAVHWIFFQRIIRYFLLRVIIVGFWLLWHTRLD